MFQACAAAPHPDHGMSAASYNPIPGAIGETEEAARAAIPAAVAHFNFPDWRLRRMISESRVRPASFWDLPCAASGLTSYRARSPLGFIMIGARDHEEAAREAARSSDKWRNLEVWDPAARRYVAVGAAA